MTEKDDKSQKEDIVDKDKKLWEHVTRSITPLEGKDIIKPEQSKKSKPQPTPITKQETKIEPPSKSNEIDRQTARRLKRGQIPIDMCLDLHGMTQTQAFDALKHTIPSAHANGKRCLLIITGKGTRRSSSQGYKTGILKQKVPEWLNEPPLKNIILKIQTAHIKDGGEGAIYVYLRRQRT